MADNYRALLRQLITIRTKVRKNPMLILIITYKQAVSCITFTISVIIIESSFLLALVKVKSPRKLKTHSFIGVVKPRQRCFFSRILRRTRILCDAFRFFLSAGCNLPELLFLRLVGLDSRKLIKTITVITTDCLAKIN